MFIKTDYSLFLSTLSIKKAIELTVKKGYDKIVICDNNLSGIVEFYMKAKENKLKPIIGLTKVINSVEYLFIAHNYNGYTKLTIADTLLEYDSLFNEQDISVVAVNINKMDKDQPIEIKTQYASLIKEENIFDKHKNKLLSKKEILPINIANCKTNTDIFTLAYFKGINAESPGYYHNNLLSMKDKMIEMPYLKDINEEDLKKLNQIMDLCVDDYDFGHPVPPEFLFGKEMGLEYGLDDPDNDTLFEFLCRKGLSERLNGEYNKIYEDRLETEMKIIKEMKFSGYMLIVFDFIKYAKKQKIPVGPGRGSAAGSLVAYSLWITNIDPIPYNLLFERFLNPERVSLPDIDIDFCGIRRIEVINYVVEKYGRDRVAQVITFGKIGPKSGIRDVNRVLMNPGYVADKMVKLIPDTLGINCKDSYAENKEAFDLELKEDYFTREIWPVVIDLEGLKKQKSIHAAGLVISNDNIYNRAPLYNVGGVTAIGIDGKYLEDLNLVKYDFLGLKNLTVIDKTIISIKKNLGITIDPYNLPRTDSEVFKYISTGNSIGLFQIESAGMQDLAKRMQPNNFEEIIAMIALFRPGPMEAGMLDSFINRKHGREEISYFFKEMEEALKPILEPTYGVIVYQEQVMQIVQAIAGFSLGEADLVRRAMGKKKPEEMAKISKDFVKRSVVRGYKAEEAASLFDLIAKFAGYGFNKSHSAAYAVLSYVTAYLKYYYPTTFITNLINNDLDNVDKIGILIREAKQNGIKVFNPDIVNGSDVFIENESKKEIIFGLKGVKSVGSSVELLIKNAKELPEGANLKDLLKITQRDVKKEEILIEKEVNKLTKVIEKLSIKINEYPEKCDIYINKIKNKKINKNTEVISYTEKEIEMLKRREEENNKNIEDKNIKVEELKQQELLLEDLRKEMISINSTTSNRVNKTTLEVLGKIGAFDNLGVSRKDIINNVESLLNYDKIDSVQFKNEDISDKEKIEFELQYMGVIITDPFKKERDLLNKLEINESFFIGVVIKLEEKKTKAQKPYVRYSFLTTSNEMIDMNDFNGKLKHLEIGSKAIIQFTHNESNFKNILKCIEYSSKNIEIVSYMKEEVEVLNKTEHNQQNNEASEMTVNIFQDMTSIPDCVKNLTIIDIDNTILMVLKR